MMRSRNKIVAIWSAVTLITFLIFSSAIPAATRGIVINTRSASGTGKQIRSKHVLMAFDSCFSGAIFQMVRSKPSLYIQEKVTYPVRQFITSGTEGEQVPDKSIFKDGTVTDRRTGLMWQKEGSRWAQPIRPAQGYVKKLNKKKFAGYADWRMPTIEELASLLAQNKISGLHIDAVFGKKQKRCWSSDRPKNVSMVNRQEAWIIDFRNGLITKARWSDRKEGFKGGAGRGINTDNYVRAVRSMR